MHDTRCRLFAYAYDLMIGAYRQQRKSLKIQGPSFVPGDYTGLSRSDRLDDSRSQGETIGPDNPKELGSVTVHHQETQDMERTQRLHGFEPRFEATSLPPRWRAYFNLGSLFEPSAMSRGDSRNRNIFKSEQSPHRSSSNLLSNPIHQPYLLRENLPQPQCSSSVSLPPSWLSVSSVIAARFDRWSLTSAMILAAASTFASPVPAESEPQDHQKRICSPRSCS